MRSVLEMNTHPWTLPAMGTNPPSARQWWWFLNLLQELDFRRRLGRRIKEGREP